MTYSPFGLAGQSQRLPLWVFGGYHMEYVSGGRVRACVVGRPITSSFAAESSPMGDIKNPTVLYIKGGLMLVVGLLASALLIARTPDLRTVTLLAVAVWGFCRAYYFAFYVIQNYVDSGYKFAGLCSFLHYLAQRRHR